MGVSFAVAVESQAAAVKAAAVAVLVDAAVAILSSATRSLAPAVAAAVDTPVPVVVAKAAVDGGPLLLEIAELPRAFRPRFPEAYVHHLAELRAPAADE